MQLAQQTQSQCRQVLVQSQQMVALQRSQLEPSSSATIAAQSVQRVPRH
jgi:hypothetical protein